MLEYVILLLELHILHIYFWWKREKRHVPLELNDIRSTNEGHSFLGHWLVHFFDMLFGVHLNGQFPSVGSVLGNELVKEA